MSDPRSPIASDKPENGATLLDLVYDRETDIARASYDDGTTISFLGCSKYQYGLCLIADKEADGSWNTSFVALDDKDVNLYAMMIAGQRENLNDDQVATEYDRISKHIATSFRRVGIPATYRRMDHFILPRIEMLDAAELRRLLPGAIDDASVARLEVGDHAFSGSVLTRRP